jgi:hypothetical protein
MTAVIRNLASVVLLLACLAGLAPAWLGPDGADWAGCWRDLVEARRRGERLDRDLRAIAERTAAKDGAVRELIGGRLTLAEAAARFRAADESAGARFGRYWRWSDRPEGERLCRQVIEWVRVELRSGGAAPGGRLLLERLEAELAAHLGHYGRVDLPGG